MLASQNLHLDPKGPPLRRFELAPQRLPDARRRSGASARRVDHRCRGIAPRVQPALDQPRRQFAPERFCPARLKVRQVDPHEQKMSAEIDAARRA